MCSGLRSQLEASDQHWLVAVREAEERGRAAAKGAISTFSRIHSSLSKGVLLILCHISPKVFRPGYYFLLLIICKVVQTQLHSPNLPVKSTTSDVRTDLSALRELAVRFSRGLYEDTTAACRQVRMQCLPNRELSSKALLCV